MRTCTPSQACCKDKTFPMPCVRHCKEQTSECRTLEVLCVPMPRRWFRVSKNLATDMCILRMSMLNTARSATGVGTYCLFLHKAFFTSFFFIFYVYVFLIFSFSLSLSLLSPCFKRLYFVSLHSMYFYIIFFFYIIFPLLSLCRSSSSCIGASARMAAFRFHGGLSFPEMPIESHWYVHISTVRLVTIALNWAAGLSLLCSCGIQLCGSVMATSSTSMY